MPFDRQTKSRAEIAEVMQTIARKDSVVVHALESGASAIGTEGVDAGGPAFKPLEQPNALLPGQQSLRRTSKLFLNALFFSKAFDPLPEE